MDELNNNEFNAEPTNMYVQEKGTPVFGIVSIITGGLSILACCVPYLPIALAIAGIVFGIVAIVKKEKLIGLAIAGIICGGIYVLLLIIGIIMLGSIDIQGLLDQYKDMGIQ